MTGGPQPISNKKRWALADEISAQIQTHYGNRLKALGVYGSLAANRDGPYSDIEMHCVIVGTEIDECFEWSAGPWKAEVDVYSRDVILAWAQEVEWDWSITHGAYVHVKPIFDPDGFFPELKQATLSQPAEVIRERLAEFIVGEIYEMVGKIRNACSQSETDLLPIYTGKLAVYGAGLLGLSHRYLYSTFGRIFTEALKLPDHPLGFESLCRLVASGDLRDHGRILDHCNQFWSGIESWADRHNLRITTSLESLLVSEK